ncbi:MAG: S8 family serine peptidase [bacterium]|jgi:subtilisin family serine protease|nr:S8 family serine peptidase [bacterium]
MSRIHPRSFLVTLLALSMTFASVPVHALTPDDEFLDEQWYLETIDAYAAWDMETGDGSVVVAILDTGVDLDHPDLESNIWVNDGEIAGDGIDNDGNGYVDDVNGYDFIDEDGTPIPTDDGDFDIGAVSHGTVIAGIIGAVGDNDEGIAGINWDVQLMSVRILDNQGAGNSSLAYQGVNYAIENGADVINLSFTGFDIDQNLRSSLEDAYEAGIVVVAAMGNSDHGINIDHQAIFPACYGERADEDWILGVAATDDADERSTFSNFGAECTDISAPGEDIYSAIYQDDDWEEVSEGYYQSGWSGTSMAAPMVAGAAALLKSAHHSLTPNNIKSILRLSVDPVTATGAASGKMGAGRLNLATALSLAPSFVDDEDTADSSSEGAATESRSSYRIAVAPESGGPPTVKVFDNSGSEVITSFNAYDENFSGGVRLTMGDVDGDGVEEIVTVPATGSSHVRVFSLEGEEKGSFFAFEETLSSGLYVATGDTDGDGVEEIAVSTDEGGGARVAVFELDGTVSEDSFSPYADFTGKRSVRVALGDVDGDGTDEIITSLGSGHEPLIRVHEPDGEFVSEFHAYASSYQEGVFVASGDLDGDGDDEIVTGTDNGGGPQVQIYDGQGNWLGTFFAYDDQFRGGVRLSVGNLSEWPGASIITAAGPGGGPHIRVYNGYAELIGTFFSDDENDRGGINSAAWGL